MLKNFRYQPPEQKSNTKHRKSCEEINLKTTSKETIAWQLILTSWLSFAILLLL